MNNDEVASDIHLRDLLYIFDSPSFQFLLYSVLPIFEQKHTVLQKGTDAIYTLL